MEGYWRIIEDLALAENKVTKKGSLTTVERPDGTTQHYSSSEIAHATAAGLNQLRVRNRIR